MSENLSPGAGGKGTSGYWGYGTDENAQKIEDRYEDHLRKQIEIVFKRAYKCTAHSVLTCKTCTTRNLIHWCSKSQRFGFDEQPKIKVTEGGYHVTKCAYCGDSLRRVRAGKHKRRD